MIMFGLSGGETESTVTRPGSAKDRSMVARFKVLVSEQGQAFSVAILAFLFGAALLLGFL
jgi:hypothetical protein